MLYLDTSFLAPLLLEEASSSCVEAYVARLPAGELFVSHWTRVEFASLVAREVRMGGLSRPDAGLVLDQFEGLIDESFHVVLPDAADYQLAREFLAGFATSLRGGDALHLAIARNHGAKRVLSLDDGLLKAARTLKVMASKGIR